MTSQRQKKAGFELPAPVLGWPLMDICLKIPDAPEYRRAFLGHIYKLGLWAAWEKSYLPGDTRAKEAGQLWRDVLNQYLDMGCEMSCCCPEPNGTRFNADGSSSVTYDGGTTWVPNPNDPRTSAPQLPPPSTPPGADTKCKAANNVLQQMKDAQSSFATKLGTGLSILQLAIELAGVVALVFFTVGAAAFLVPLVLTLAGGLVGLSAAAYNALFTTSVWDFALCTIYCNMADDGSFSQSNFNTIMAKFDSAFTGNLALTFSGILSGWQLVGLQNAARIPSTSNLDCSGCDCGSCLTNWSVFGAGHGVIDDVTDEYIEAHGTDPGNGNYYLILKTPTVFSCCTVAMVETVSGGFTLQGWTDCGQPQVEGVPQHTGLGWGTCINYFQAQSATPFTIRIYFVDC